MRYNIDFDIAGAIFLSVYYVFLKIQYTTDTPSNKEFKRLVLWVFAATVLDAASAVTISYAMSVPLWVNYLLNGAYYAASALCSYYLPVYISVSLSKEREWSVFDKISLVVLNLYFLIVLSNPFTGWLFDFKNEQHEYTHGPLYLLLFIVPIIFVACALIKVITNRKKLKKKQYVSLVVFVIIVELMSLVQMIFLREYLITFFGTAVAAFVLMISLETPDYNQLVKTLDELKAAKEEAEDAKVEAYAANSAKSAFLANMSHEIRTPINGILGMNEIALRENKDPEITECLINIRDAGKNLLTIVNDVLDFSKIESGKMDIVDAEYALGPILYSVYNLINQKALDKNLTLKIENEPEIPYKMKGDSSRIQQIIVNLLNNAVKYTKEGTVTLSVGQRENLPGTIDLIIKVQDTGIGISDENMDKLFKSFQRVDLKKNRNIEGSGLGLMITKQLAELMGGTIFVESKVNQGSTFTVIVPQEIVNSRPMGRFSPDDFKHESEIKKEEDLIAPEAHILVVDDVMVNLKVVCGLLKKTQIKIDTVTSGIAALYKCRDTKYDVIYLDHMMPEMDGIETFKKLKENKAGINCETPVVILTANAIQGVKEEYLSQGFNDYLSKPIDSAMLKETLRKYIPKEKLEG